MLSDPFRAGRMFLFCVSVWTTAAFLWYDGNIGKENVYGQALP